MGLTWDEFLKLATVISNLGNLLYYFDYTENEVKELNRIVAATAKGYLKFFNDFKYMQFMKEVR